MRRPSREVYGARLEIDATRGSDAVIALRAVLTDDDGAVLMTGQYESSTPSASPTADDLIVAWNTSLDSVLAQLAGDLGEGHWLLPSLLGQLPRSPSTVHTATLGRT